jgi:hypothetical protein
LAQPYWCSLWGNWTLQSMLFELPKSAMIWNLAKWNIWIN